MTYLKAVMCKLGFSNEWISTVMRCVTNVRYAVRINGELSEPFVPMRGLRQADPISPYLFLICGEGLSCLMKKKNMVVPLEGSRMEEWDQQYLICSLRMTVFFS